MLADRQRGWRRATPFSVLGLASNLLLYRAMHRFALLMLVACAADPKLEPSANSSVDFKDEPVYDYDLLRSTDLLFVVDSEVPIASRTAQLADAIEAYNTAVDLHIAVVSADPAATGLVGDRVLHVVDLPTGGDRGDFTDALSDELAALVPAATQSSNQPLARIANVVEQHPEFRRSDARLFVVPITNRDDESPDSVESYRARITPAGDPHDVVIQPLAASAPRIEAFANRASIPLDALDWGAALGELGNRLSTLPLVCFDEPLVQPYQCSFQIVLDQQATALPLCDASAARPCVTLHAKPSCVAAQHLSYDVSWAEWPTAGTRVVSQCVIDSSSI